MRDYLPFRYWMKFKECEITRAGNLPFFCLNLLYTQNIPDPDQLEPSLASDIRDKTVWKAYWYCLN